ncbi:hypothetical protein QA640_21080 [Bradyrhizobium sp. CB82]|uniref:hypothetical protein n=1 Tax=Bradyrhizobium sp. CB82 TaxID=3039159 RepID=UPI0024B0A6DC|nr:hypothetical protein [Bradyrhizobium sp. CB82]WFU44725.1 hypothetical protein QA640_21080 [Bradyrhizobium sp. CB82]
MGNRTAKFISALFASVLAGAPLAAVSQNAPSGESAQNAPSGESAQNSPSGQSAQSAADDCLASPKATAPEGQHWYYRIERGTKRKCWYLREEGAKVAQGTQSPVPAQKSDAPAPRSVSVQDAHAELTTQNPAPAPDTTASIPAPSAPVAPPATLQRPVTVSDADAAQPTVDARWPDPNVSPAPAPQTAPAPKLADARPAPKPQASPSAGTMTLASADAPAEKPTGSLQTLLLVVSGALALAGITGSIIYRFAGSRARVQAEGGRRRINWDNWEPTSEDKSRAPWVNAAATTAPRAQRTRPVDFGAALAAAANANGASASRVDQRIEDAMSGPQDLDVQDLDVQDLDVQDLDVQDFDAEDLDAEDLDTEDLDREELHTASPKETAEPHVAAVDAAADDGHNGDADAVDIDAITAMLERLAKEGPRLAPSSPEADLADLVQSQRRQSAARA